MSGSNTPNTTASAGEDVKLDLSEDEEGQQESSEVKKVVWTTNKVCVSTLSAYQLIDICASSC